MRLFRASTNGGGPEFFVPPTSGTANGLPVFNWDEAAAQITRDNVSWANALGTAVTVTYAFRSSVTSAERAQWPTGVSGFSQFNATQIAVTQEVLTLWS